MMNGNLKQKVEQICIELGITIIWLGIGDNRACRINKTIELKHIGGSGDFAVALHEIGHTQCDPNNEPASAKDRLDAETDAWKWALKRNDDMFDVEGWYRLHKSLGDYFRCVMDTSHPAFQLLILAEKQSDVIPRRFSSYAPNIHLASKKTKLSRD